MDWNERAEVRASGLCLMADGNDDGGAGAGAAGGGGGAADVIAGGGGDSGAGGQGGSGSGEGGSGAGGGGLDPLLGMLSAEGGDASNPSNRDWLQAKGFKSADDLIKSYREAEKAIRNPGSVLKVPGDDATPEERAAYHKAIGVPESADKYEVILPEGAEPMPVLDNLRTAALELGVPAPAFKGLAEAFIQHQLDEADALAKDESDAAKQWERDQGAQLPQRKAEIEGAMRALGLDMADVIAMQQAFNQVRGEPGAPRVLNMLAKLGGGMAEDVLIGGGGQQRFGISGAEAQSEINRLIADPEFGQKLASGDTTAKARWDRLNAAVAAARDAEKRAAA